MNRPLTLHAVPNAEGKPYVKLPPDKEMSHRIAAWREVLHDQINLLIAEHPLAQKWMGYARCGEVENFTRGVSEGMLATWSDQIIRESVVEDKGNLTDSREEMVMSVEPVVLQWFMSPQGIQDLKYQIAKATDEYLKMQRPCTLEIRELRERMWRIIENNRITRHRQANLESILPYIQGEAKNIRSERVLDAKHARELYLRHCKLRRSEMIAASLLYERNRELYEKNRELWLQANAEQRIPLEFSQYYNHWIAPLPVDEVRDRVKKKGAFFMHYPQEKLRNRILDPDHWVINRTEGMIVVPDHEGNPYLRESAFGCDMQNHTPTTPDGALEFDLPDVIRFGLHPPGFTIHDGAEILYEICENRMVVSCTADMCSEEDFASRGLMSKTREKQYRDVKRQFPQVKYNVAEVGSVVEFHPQGAKPIMIADNPIANEASEKVQLKERWEPILGWEHTSKVDMPLRTDMDGLPPSHYVILWKSFVHRFDRFL